MDPIMQAIYFGKADELIRDKNPNEEEQLPETQNDVMAAWRQWNLDPTEIHGKAYVSALQRCGHYDEADKFALKNLKSKPKFTIIEGF
jgi:hypothetical protein